MGSHFWDVNIREVKSKVKSTESLVNTTEASNALIRETSLDKNQ